ncbi:MAG: NAD(P)-dependent oxidoreductase [Bacillota bacterium]|nr:NAD(P)-dependent oxidoreductase [Bacillota bacterium]
MKVAIMESLGIAKERLDQLKKPFEKYGVKFYEYERTSDVHVLIEQAKDKDVMIVADMPIRAEVIRACDKLRFINIAFTGFNHVDIDAAFDKKVAVSNASGYSTEAVSELVIGMAISKMRNMVQVEQRLRASQTKEGLIGHEIKGKTIGIVGLGKIGTRTAELFHAFGAKILASSRTVHADAPSYVSQVALNELLKESDIVILHCPLTEETRHLINREKLKMMKNTAILINVARGDVVKEEDLCFALRNHHIAGACIDVFSIEPPLEGDEEILSAPNTLLTPHIAFASAESMELRAEIVFENLRAWMEGKQQNVVLK